MEGIQHRRDCPAKDQPPMTDYIVEHTDGTQTYRLRCDGCGRAAVIHGRVSTEHRQPRPEGSL